MAYFRELSRVEWAAGEKTIEAINAGSLQRIADATEKMAANYTSMQEDRDRYKKWYYEKRDECERLGKVISGLRGQVTKQVNRARAAERNPLPVSKPLAEPETGEAAKPETNVIP